MTVFPGAAWRPMPGQEKRGRRQKGRGVGFHIAVTERASIYDINLGTGNDAHLYVLRDGTVEQNIDLDLIAYAGAAGNSTMIWVETQGGTTAADVKSGRWDPAQAETLAQIAAWANATEGVPLQVMPDSRPASRGIGTHRLGIQHSAGIGAVAGFLVAGGEKWSSAVGKECPGDARVGQVPSIVARAQQIRSGAPAPTVQEDDDMKIIQSPARGLAVIGPGYFRQLLNPEEAANAVAICGPAIVGNDRQFDLWAAIASTGTTAAAGTLAQLGAAVAALSGRPAADVDEAALAALLAPKLSAGASKADVEDALRQVLREGTGTGAST